MGLKFLESFDHYAYTQVLSKWDYGNLTNNWINPGRTNNSVKLSNSGLGFTPNFLRKNITFGSNVVIVGFAYRTPALPGAAFEAIVSFGDTGFFHWALCIDSAGSLEANKSSSSTGGEAFPASFDNTLSISAAGLVQPNTWNYIEIKTTISTTSSATVTVNFNGVQVINISGSGAINSNHSSSVNQVNFHGTGATHENHIDDIYIYDNQGANCNDFAGDTKVVVSFPDSDAGTNQFVPSTAGAHYLMVNETVPDDDTTYLSDATVNDREQFGMQNLDVSVTVVKCVMSWDYSRKDDATTRKIAHQLGDGGASLTTGADISLGQTYAYHPTPWETCPVGSVAWTPTNFNAIKAGIKITA